MSRYQINSMSSCVNRISYLAKNHNDNKIHHWACHRHNSSGIFLEVWIFVQRVNYQQLVYNHSYHEQHDKRHLRQHRTWYKSAWTSSVYLTIIPRVRVEYELAITISYATSASGIIVLLKTPKEIPQHQLRSLQKKTRIHLTNLWSMVYELIYHSL